MIELDDSADGRAIELRSGGEFQISLKENPSTGFGWVVEGMAENVCDLAHDHFETASVTARGSGGIHHWRLRAKQKGEGKIILSYRRSGAAQPASRTFTVTIRVN